MINLLKALYASLKKSKLLKIFSRKKATSIAPTLETKFETLCMVVNNTTSEPKKVRLLSSYNGVPAGITVESPTITNYFEILYFMSNLKFDVKQVYIRSSNDFMEGESFHFKSIKKNIFGYQWQVPFNVNYQDGQQAQNIRVKNISDKEPLRLEMGTEIVFTINPNTELYIAFNGIDRSLK